jgi:hypothetical protein
MTSRMKTLAASAVLAASFAAPVWADGKKDCTTEPQANWKSAADAEAAAKAAGYDVRKSKIEGACYEVYAVKDGKNLELFYNPVDLKLLHTVQK